MTHGGLTELLRNACEDKDRMSILSKGRMDNLCIAFIMEPKATSIEVLIILHMEIHEELKSRVRT